MNAKIKKLINHIYGESFSDAHLDVLLSKLEQAAIDITEKRKSGWDEKDVVLITYADQFSAEGEKALPVFTRFYNKWLSHSFSHVHLLPFYPWSSDDGFSVIDYHDVAPETGTWQDIAELKQSASLMFECVMMWNYILEEGLEGWGEDDYAFYGLPLFKATAVKYGWDNPIGEDSGRERKYDSQY